MVQPMKSYNNTLNRLYMSYKVSVLVVTFNRKKLLERCVQSIIRQSYPISSITIVDNNSSDGSYEYITTKFAMTFAIRNINFEWKRLKENCGGAGGFSCGVNLIRKTSYDFIWMMDDDGFPDKDCLLNLISHASTNSYIGPIVLSDKDKATLSFPLRLRKSLRVIDTIEDLKSYGSILHGVILPFNGTLLSGQLIKKIGAPDERFFIWGDEVDFTERARANGAEIFTVTTASFYHPKANNIGSPMFFGLLRFNDSDSLLKLYCYCRNNLINLKKYKNPIFPILFVLKTFFYFSFTRPNLKKMVLCMRAFHHGILNDFTHHKEYIK